MTYALDSNTVIRYLRKDKNVLKRFDAAVSRGDDLLVPKVVDYEVQRGFRIVNAPAKEAAYKFLTGASGYCEVAAMDNYSWSRAERIYTELYHKHLTIGELDILIAAYCLEHGYTLVTNNTKDFENIDGLQHVDWVKE